VSAKVPKEIEIEKHQSDEIYSVAFSPGSEFLVDACQDKSIKVWRIAETLKVVQGVSFTSPVKCVAFSPDGRIMASGVQSGYIYLFKMSEGKWISYNNNLNMTHVGDVYDVVFSYDNKTLASASADRKVKLWDVEKKNLKKNLKGTLEGHRQDIICVCFSLDNKTLASASYDETVKLWDVSGDTPKEKSTLTQSYSFVRTMAFSPDGNTLALGTTGNAVKLFDVSGDTPELKGTLSVVARESLFVKFSPDGKTITVGSADNKGWALSMFKNSDPIKLARDPKLWPLLKNLPEDIVGIVVGKDPDLYYTPW